MQCTVITAYGVRDNGCRTVIYRCSCSCEAVGPKPRLDPTVCAGTCSLTPQPTLDQLVSLRNTTRHHHQHTSIRPVFRIFRLFPVPCPGSFHSFRLLSHLLSRALRDPPAFQDRSPRPELFSLDNRGRGPFAPCDILECPYTCDTVLSSTTPSACPFLWPKAWEDTPRLRPTAHDSARDLGRQPTPRRRRC